MGRHVVAAYDEHTWARIQRIRREGSEGKRAYNPTHTSDPELLGDDLFRFMVRQVLESGKGYRRAGRVWQKPAGDEMPVILKPSQGDAG
jgi:hypothetical protein